MSESAISPSVSACPPIWNVKNGVATAGYTSSAINTMTWRGRIEARTHLSNEPRRRRRNGIGCDGVAVGV